jgi:hypothetical protein
MRSRTASLSRFVLGAACVGLFLCHTAGAQPIVANVTVDENGNGIGTLGPGFLAGVPSVLTYDLPFATIPGAVLIPGDVLLVDGGVVLDVIRFNSVDFDGFAALDASPFTLVFYSDNIGGIDAPADTGLPAFDPNGVRIDELGPEGNNGAFYTPTEGQPGYVEFGPFGLQGFTYHFISDGTIPEPSSTALLSLGLAVLVLGAGQRRRTRA